MQGDSSQGNPANKTNPCQEVPSAALLLRGVVCGRASYPAHSEYLYHIFLGVLPALVHSTECSSRLDCCTRYSPCVAHAAPRCRISASKVTEQENRVGTMTQSSVPGQQQHLLTDEDDATAVPGKPRPRAAQVRGPQAPGPRSRDPLILLVILLRLKLAECSSWRGRWARLVVYQEWIPPPPIAPSLGPRPRARPRPVGSTRRLAPVPRAPLRLRFPFQRASVEQSQTKDRHSLTQQRDGLRRAFLRVPAFLRSASSLSPNASHPASPSGRRQHLAALRISINASSAATVWALRIVLSTASRIICDTLLPPTPPVSHVAASASP